MPKMDLKSVTAGLVAGIVIGTFSVAAYTASNPITAYQDNRFGFVFDGGERKFLEGGLSTIVYNDRSYVAVTFLAENMGATVKWNDASKTINIDTPKKIVEVEKIVEVCPVEPITQKNYNSLPQTYVDKNLRVDITSFDRNKDEINSNFYLAVENKGQDPWQIELFETRFIADDGKTYSTKGVPVGKYNTRFYDDIRKDEEISGYVTVASIPETVKGGLLQITIRKNTIENDRIVMEFPIKVNQ